MSHEKEVLAQSLSALAIWLFALLVGSASVAGEAKIVTIKGEIEVAAFGDDETVEAVAVYDRAWGTVLISNEGKGTQLLDHVGDFAEITGTIVEIDEESEGFSYEITVTAYTIEESEDPEDGEDWDPEAPE